MTQPLPTMSDVLRSENNDVLRDALRLYVAAHRAPELSGREEGTANLLSQWLGRTGYEVSAGVGGYGVVGRLTNGPGPTVLLRAELDALPLPERTGLSYASTATAVADDGECVPVMHACGHDMHLACLSAAASLLARIRSAWTGTLLVVGQPAEETLSGARAMLDAGLYERFGRPDVALAQHVAPFPAGLVGHVSGRATAANARIDVTIRGRGGHPGIPEATVDPVVAAAAIVLRLQTVVAREVTSPQQALVTVGALRAGHRYNIVPESASLSIAARSMSESHLRTLVDAVGRIARAECAISACADEPLVEVSCWTPPTVNDPAVLTAVRAAHEGVFGRHSVLTLPGTLASDDFSLLTRADESRLTCGAIPALYWFVGSVAPGQWAETSALEGRSLPAPPAPHSSGFAPAAGPTLRTGAVAMVTAALSQLRRRPADP